MKLTLCSLSKTVHIEIAADQFRRLRDPHITVEEISSIASACDVDSGLLIDYVQDLGKSARGSIELDGACDYSDHM